MAKIKKLSEGYLLGVRDVDGHFHSVETFEAELEELLKELKFFLEGEEE